MRIHELFERTELDELNLKQALAAGVIATAAMAGSKEVVPNYVPTETELRFDKLTQQVKKLYSLPAGEAEKIVKTALEHEKKTFPKAEDILAVIAIESSFNKDARSNLKQDPAVGLMQIRPKIWKLPVQSLQSIEGQIKTGTDILHNYYNKLGHNINATLQAYNVGITNFINDVYNERYVNKFLKARASLTNISV